MCKLRLQYLAMSMGIITISVLFYYFWPVSVPLTLVATKSTAYHGSSPSWYTVIGGGTSLAKEYHLSLPPVDDKHNYVVSCGKPLHRLTYHRASKFFLGQHDLGEVYSGKAIYTTAPFDNTIYVYRTPKVIVCNSEGLDY